MKTLADLIMELDVATAAHADAYAHEQATSRDLTAARNRLNEAQKALDKAVDDLRSKAPWNTDWHSKRNPGVPVNGTERHGD